MVPMVLNLISTSLQCLHTHVILFALRTRDDNLRDVVHGTYVDDRQEQESTSLQLVILQDLDIMESVNL
jgi:hypothetical protein